MAWLTVMGIGEDGLAGLKPEHRQKTLDARLVVAAKRHVAELKAEKAFAGKALPWPSPFLDIIPMLKSHRKKPVVILATGDPLWYGAASTLVRYFEPEEMAIHPTSSGFQLAAARMGWPMHTVECLTVHGRPPETILPHLAPRARLLVLAHDRHSTSTLAAMAIAAGFGTARVTALGHIGGNDETRQEETANAWAKGRSRINLPPDFHVVAIECPSGYASNHPGGFLPKVPGLPDEVFQSDGKLTKSEVRAVTLARLGPHSGGMLWDLGCGSGSIGIEWMRAARGAMAIGIDTREDRLAVAKSNALRLGVPQWEGQHGILPKAIKGLPDPDAVFIGGGLSRELVKAVLRRLPLGGRLVVNAVTLESEELLLGLWKEYGGDLVRISSSRAEAIGGMHGWRPLMPVTQWSLAKSGPKPLAKPKKPARRSR